MSKEDMKNVELKTTAEAISDMKQTQLEDKGDGFDPYYTAERKALKMAVEDLKLLVEAVDKRVDLIKVLHDEKSRGHEVFAYMTDEQRKQVFSTVYTFDMKNVKKLGKALTDSDKALSRVLRSLN